MAARRSHLSRTATRTATSAGCPCGSRAAPRGWRARRDRASVVSRPPRTGSLALPSSPDTPVCRCCTCTTRTGSRSAATSRCRTSSTVRTSATSPRSCSRRSATRSPCSCLNAGVTPSPVGTSTLRTSEYDPDRDPEPDRRQRLPCSRCSRSRASSPATTSTGASRARSATCGLRRKAVSTRCFRGSPATGSHTVGTCTSRAGRTSTLYAITDAGRAAVQAWLETVEPGAPADHRASQALRRRPDDARRPAPARRATPGGPAPAAR